jgi:hypothetical protein
LQNGFSSQGQIVFPLFDQNDPVSIDIDSKIAVSRNPEISGFYCRLFIQSILVQLKNDVIQGIHFYQGRNGYIESLYPPCREHAGLPVPIDRILLPGEGKYRRFLR